MKIDTNTKEIIKVCKHIHINGVEVSKLMEHQYVDDLNIHCQLCMKTYYFEIVRF